MPYTHCPSCRLATFSAAAHSSRDECPRCGTLLEPHPRRLFVVPDADPRFAAPPSFESPSEVA
jgi:ribosomal protein S27AE